MTNDECLKKSQIRNPKSELNSPFASRLSSRGHFLGRVAGAGHRREEHWSNGKPRKAFAGKSQVRVSLCEAMFVRWVRSSPGSRGNKWPSVNQRRSLELT